MEHVVAHVKEVIDAAGGCIGFDRYMREVLYAPGLGYYSAGSTKFGAAGDFTTAPEISSVFARCLARQCAEVLAETGGDILEIGPGTGRLAADLLAELKTLDMSPARYRLLEVSAALRARQAETLGNHSRVSGTSLDWLDAPPADRWQGVLLANEVLDALPIRCFEITAARRAGRVLERVVVAGQRGLAWDAVPADDALCAAVAHIESGLARPLPPGYCSEVCWGLGDWLRAVLAGLERGVVLLSDYGLPRASYYLEERNSGTLICHYRHRAHDNPFLYPGLQDLSAWVDFTAVAEAAVALGFDLAGFATQAHFLIGAGLEDVVGRQVGDGSGDSLRLASEIKTLTLPGEMGERFKFMALSRNFSRPLAGFGFKDMRDKL